MKLVLKALLIYVCFINVEVSYSMDSRIIGGSATNITRFPFMAFIRVEHEVAQWYCGGALISDEWVLTSGHCTVGFYVYVTLGSTSSQNQDPDRVTINGSDFLAHPNFDPVTLVNDIGLIRLAVRVRFTEKIQPIKIATINLPNILHPTALGWGQTSDDDPDIVAADLHYVQLNILTNEACKLIYGDQIVDNMVCVKGNNNEGTCLSDTGSPLVVRPLGSSVLQHVGVSSFFSGNGCETPEPSGFTRTFPYLDWIKSVTGIEI